MQSKHIDKLDKDVGAEVEHQNWLKFKRFKDLEHGKEDKEKKKAEKSQKRIVMTPQSMPNDAETDANIYDLSKDPFPSKAQLQPSLSMGIESSESETDQGSSDEEEKLQEMREE